MSTVLIVVLTLLAPPLVAILICRDVHDYILDRSGSRGMAVALGIVLGIPIAIALTAGPLYLWSVYAQSHGLYQGNDGANVAGIFTKLLEMLGCGIGLVFGAGAWSRK